MDFLTMFISKTFKVFFNSFFAVLLLAFSAPSKANEAGIVLTFDDQSIAQWHSYFSNQSSEVKATFFASHWHLFSASEKALFQDLQNSGHEIAAHTYDHSGALAVYGLDPTRITEYLNEQIIPSLNNMVADGFSPVSFAYPHGEHNEAYDTAVRDYFPYLRGVSGFDTSALNQIDGIYHNTPKNYQYLDTEGMDTINNRTFNDIRNSLIRAKNNNEIVNLFAHRILEPFQIGTTLGMSRELLDQVIQEAKDQGLKFYTYAEAYQLGNNGSVTTQVSGNDVQVTWGGIESDFIGIVPFEEDEWQQGMPQVSYQLLESGNETITVPNPLNQQQYRAIFYKNNIRRFISEPFYFLNTTTPPVSPSPLTPIGNTIVGSAGVTVSWDAVPGVSRYEYEAYVTDTDGVIDDSSLIFAKQLTATEANCPSGTGVCNSVESVSSNVTTGKWKIRSWNVITKGDYSDKVAFNLETQINSDTTPPIITLLGSDPVTVALNSNYVDAGANATDNVDTTVTVIIDSSAVNTSQAGSYTVTFNASDVAGNDALLVTRSVIVSDAPIAPISPTIISPSGQISSNNSEVTLSWNSVQGATSYDFIGYEVTATDSIDYSSILFDRRISSEDAGCSNGGICSISENIFVLSGVWKIRSNSEALSSEYSDKTFFTITDASPPVLIPPTIISPSGSSLTNSGVVMLSWNSVPGATSYDFSGYAVDTSGNIDYSNSQLDGVVSSLDAGCVNGGICSIPRNLSATSGFWKIRSNSDIDSSEFSDKTFYSLTDSGSIDTTPPIITLQGVNPVTITLNSNYIDAGASATDYVDGQVSVNINISAVNTSQAGSYSAVFTATDSSGNSISLTRTIVVSDGATLLLPPSIISPMGPTSSINGVLTLRWNAVPGATSYDFTGYQVMPTGNVNYGNVIFDSLISSIDAGCETSGICTTTQSVNVDAGAWKIRSNSDIQKSEYSDRAYFTSISTDGSNPVSSKIILQGNSILTLDVNSSYIDAGASAFNENGDIVNVQVDTSAVDTSKAGIYKVIYTTTDLSGGSSIDEEVIKTRTVNVVDTTSTSQNGGGSIAYLILPMFLIGLRRRLTCIKLFQ